MSIYMKIKDIKGNVTAQGLENTIQLLSFDLSFLRNIKSPVGVVADRESAKPTFKDVTISKFVDNTSPLLVGEALQGKSIDEIEFTWVNTGKNLQTYQTVTLYNVLISSYDQETGMVDGVENTTGEIKKPVETLGLNFTKFEIKYTPYDEKHRAQSPVPFGYDLQTAKAS